MTLEQILERLEHLEGKVAADGCRLDEFADELASFRAQIDGTPPELDGVRWRRWMLQELKKLHYRAASPSGAAIAIAGDWRAYAEARPNRLPERRSRDWFFAELQRQGCPPMSSGTIRGDLHPSG